MELSDGHVFTLSPRGTAMRAARRAAEAAEEAEEAAAEEEELLLGCI